jgi:hypothetical protein
MGTCKAKSYRQHQQQRQNDPEYFSHTVWFYKLDAAFYPITHLFLKNSRIIALPWLS